MDLMKMFESLDWKDEKKLLFETFFWVWCISTVSSLVGAVVASFLFSREAGIFTFFILEIAVTISSVSSVLYSYLHIRSRKRVFS